MFHIRNLPYVIKGMFCLKKKYYLKSYNSIDYKKKKENHHQVNDKYMQIISNQIIISTFLSITSLIVEGGKCRKYK